MTKDPVGTSGTNKFISCCFNYKAVTTSSSVTHNQIVSEADNTKFIRYSVSAQIFKFGTSSTDVNNSCMYLYEKVEPSSFIWQLSNKIDSNSEYLICNSSASGTGKILTYSGDRVVGEDTIEIKTNNKGSYIAEGDTPNSVFYSYGLSDNTFWLDNYFDKSMGEATRVKDGELTLTSNHIDSAYHTQFAYSKNTLTLKKVFASETYTLCYDSGFKTGSGELYLYKKVYLDSTGTPIATPKPVATPVPTAVPTATPAPTSTPPRTTNSPSIEEKGYTSILTFSDYQKFTSDYQNDDASVLVPQLNSILGQAYDAGVRPDYFIFGGDFTCLQTLEAANKGKKQVTDAVFSKWTNLYDENSVLIQGNHDIAETDGLATTGPYYFDTCIIYAINEDDYTAKVTSDDSLGITEATAEEFRRWAEERINAGETRPVILATHAGIHYDIDRTDANNKYAYILFDVVNEVAEDLDIVYLFGHNHTDGDEQVGGSITFYRPGDEIEVCTETSMDDKAGTPQKLNFTYMNYGYVGYIGDIKNNESTFEPTDLLVASDIRIYNDRITVERYSANGHEEQYDGEVERTHKKIEEPAPTVVPEPTPTQGTQMQETTPTAIPDNVKVTTPSPAPQASATAVTSPSTRKPSLKVSAKKTVKRGKKLTLKAVTANTKAKIKWKVKKGNKLCKLNKLTGKCIKLTAKKKGNVKITVSCGSLKKVISIKIK